MVGHLLIMTSLLANSIGLTGLYFSCSEKLGKLGLAGFLITSFSLSLYIGKLYWSGFIYPMVALEHPEFIEAFGFGPGSDPKDVKLKTVFFSGAFSFVLGHLFLGGALLRAQIFKATPIWFVITGAILVGVWPLLPNIVQMLSVFVSLIYAIGIVWLGFLLIFSSQELQKTLNTE
ncbi:hypothetical protein F9L33_01020 [Amylibacter sp. SFDW26]|uniref:hypothetical protein n=1 Tax=Amylibacter sp. SFDW26 TaxID=2652722 RepID=UPI00126201F4|nr:hypothetical protein [Amylibacter sp. SFDW26]KAB7615380.1 hypothetical protein F9L33_01020 [Amylibacter sp. SFDW26]